MICHMFGWHKNRLVNTSVTINCSFYSASVCLLICSYPYMIIIHLKHIAYPQDHELGKKIVEEECDEIFTETSTSLGQGPDTTPGPEPGPDSEETGPGDIGDTGDIQQRGGE